MVALGFSPVMAIFAADLLTWADGHTFVGFAPLSSNFFPFTGVIACGTLCTPSSVSASASQTTCSILSLSLILIHSMRFDAQAETL